MISPKILSNSSTLIIVFFGLGVPQSILSDTDGIKFNLDTQYVDSSDPIVNDITDKLTGYYPKWSEDAWTYITEMQTRSKNQ